MRAYRRALVTGASSGIGASIAGELARRGVDLVLVARRRHRLEYLAAKLGGDVDVEVLPADLTDTEQLGQVVDRLSDEREPIDLLVNNAGFGTSGFFPQLPVADEEREIVLDVVVPVRLTHAALDGMLRRSRGGVLNVSSLAGFVVSPSSATYAASKAFVSSFSESLHAEVRHRGVHVTVLCPGFTRTEFTATAGIDDSGVPAMMWLEPDQVARCGVDAVVAGRAYAVPGRQYRVLLPLLTHVVPRAWLRAMAMRNFRPA